MTTEQEYIEQNEIYKQQRKQTHNPVAEINCLNKVRFCLQGAIQKAKCWGQSYYKCPICGWYHLTSQQTYESTMEQ